MQSSYAVVPLPAGRASAGAVDGDVVEDPLGGTAPPTRVLAVAPDEFTRFCSELEDLSENVGGVRDTRRCSELSGTRVVDFLRTRIADADFLRPGEKWLLGRGPDPAL